jgi:hypothetical protein
MSMFRNLGPQQKTAFKAAMAEKFRNNPGLLARLRARAGKMRALSRSAGDEFIAGDDFQSNGDSDVEREAGGRGYL